MARGIEAQRGDATEEVGIQRPLERAIHQLVREFGQSPYIFFTEVDAVTRFHQILESMPVFSQRVKTQDGHEVGLVHREYPTFFRFSDKNPTERLESPQGSRGHYDVAVLNPEFVVAHPAETVHNRNARTQHDEAIVPLRAVVEFKLDNLGWSAGRARGAIAELGKLKLSDESPLKYFVVLMRYTAPTIKRWNLYWPDDIEKAAQRASSVTRSLFAVHWLSARSGFEIYRFGDWLP